MIQGVLHDRPDRDSARRAFVGIVRVDRDITAGDFRTRGGLSAAVWVVMLNGHPIAECAHVDLANALASRVAGALGAVWQEPK